MVGTGFAIPPPPPGRPPGARDRLQTTPAPLEATAVRAHADDTIPTTDATPATDDGADRRHDRLVALATALAAGRLPEVGDARSAGADAAHPAPTPTPTYAVGVVGVDDADDEPFDVLVHDLDGDPAVALRGFVAPDDWQAIGLVGTASARRLDDAGARIVDLGPGPTRVAMAALLTRGGTAVQVLAPAAGEPIVLGDDGRPWSGRVPDALARCLGHATAPATGDTSKLWTLLWMDALAAATSRASDPGRTTFEQASALHPGRELVEPAMREAPVIELTAALADDLGWHEVRRAVADGTLDVPGTTPEDAAWFDDGAFQRAVLEGFPEPHDLLAHLRAALPALTYHQVLTTAVRTLELAGDDVAGRPLAG